MDGTVTSQIINGNNQTLQCVCTVPSGKVGLILGWWGSLSGKVNATVEYYLRAGRINNVGYVQQKRSTIGSSFDYSFKFPILVGQGLDIWIECESNTNNTGVSGGFTVLYKDDTYREFQV